jgi:hypothetical protein
MLEKHGVIEPLLSLEEAAYGLGEQTRIEEGANRARIRVTMRALPRRPIDVIVEGREGSCSATAVTVINGEAAQLDSVYLRTTWPAGVDYLLLTGYRLSDGRWLQERLDRH